MGLAKIALVLCLGAGCLEGWTEGRAVYYAPGLMEHMSAKRGLPVAACMAAHPTAGIGNWILVEGVRTGVRKRCRVVDTSQEWDRARHIRTGLVELDFDSAHAICPPGWDGASRLCPVKVK